MRSSSVLFLYFVLFPLAELSGNRILFFFREDYNRNFSLYFFSVFIIDSQKKCFFGAFGME